MSKTKREQNPQKPEEELETLTQKVQSLEEQLELQKTNWLYQHNTSLAVVSGVILAIVMSSLFYLINYVLYVTGILLTGFGTYLYAFITIGVPAITMPLFTFWIRAPRFAQKCCFVYIFSFVFFHGLLVYGDILGFFHWNLSVNGPLTFILAIAFLQTFVLGFVFLFLPSFANYCGYRTVLDGAVFTIIVYSKMEDVLQHLENLEEDFAFSLSDSKSNWLSFVRTIKKERQSLQFFLHASEEAKTECTLVMHSVKNDIPMRIDHTILTNLGRTIISWIKNNSGYEAFETKGTSIPHLNEEAQKLFSRRLALPSRAQISSAIKSNWKNILLIMSTLAAVLQIILRLLGLT